MLCPYCLKLSPARGDTQYILLDDWMAEVCPAASRAGPALGPVTLLINRGLAPSSPPPGLHGLRGHQEVGVALGPVGERPQEAGCRPREAGSLGPVPPATDGPPWGRGWVSLAWGVGLNQEASDLALHQDHLQNLLGKVSASSQTAHPTPSCPLAILAQLF